MIFTDLLENFAGPNQVHAQVNKCSTMQWDRAVLVEFQGTVPKDDSTNKRFNSISQKIFSCRVFVMYLVLVR